MLGVVRRKLFADSYLLENGRVFADGRASTDDNPVWMLDDKTSTNLAARQQVSTGQEVIHRSEESCLPPPCLLHRGFLETIQQHAE